MTHHALEGSRHDHSFLGARHEANERRTWIVVGLTAVMMVAEIIGGAVYGSMALIADGWHMATHAGALGVSALAYAMARRFQHDRRFAFGTGKIGDLAAFASAIVLALIALLVGYESFGRMAHPVPIAYDEALLIAAVGLAVNLASAVILHEGQHGHAGHAHHHEHDHPHPHPHEHPHGAVRDNNLRAAYLHVLADAATSVTAIAGLLAARAFDLTLIDPAVALLGVAVILWWSFGLLRDSSAVLLDCVPDRRVAEAVRQRLESRGDEVTDLHLWQVGPGHKAAVISVATRSPEPPATYKARLADIDGLCHVTVEVVPSDPGPAWQGAIPPSDDGSLTKVWKSRLHRLWRIP